MNSSVDVIFSRILPNGNLLHTSFVGSHPDINREFCTRDIDDLSSVAIAAVDQIRSTQHKRLELESRTEPAAIKELINIGSWDEQQTEDIVDSKGDSMKKNLFEDDIVWDESSQSVSDDMREEVEVEVEVGNKFEYQNMSDQLGGKNETKPEELASKVTTGEQVCIPLREKPINVKIDKDNIGEWCQRNENNLVDHVKVKRKYKEKFMPLMEKRAPRACIGKNFRYTDRFASTFVEDIAESGSLRCSKKRSNSASQAGLQGLKLSEKATNGSEKFQNSLNNDQLLDKFLDKLTKGTDHPRKFPKVDAASRAVILQEFPIMSEEEPPNIIWQPKEEDLQHVLYQAFSCHQYRAFLFHPGSVIQAYMGNEVIFVCVLGSYSRTASDHVAASRMGRDRKLRNGNMLVVFDGEKNFAINADFCLLPYSDDDILAALRGPVPSPSHDSILSAHDIAFIVNKTIGLTMKAQWRLNEVEEYFQSRSFHDDKYGFLRKSFETKTRSRLEVTRLHQYFLPLTATIKNGDHRWGERRMLQLFKRAELVLSSTSRIYRIDDHGNMTTSLQTPVEIHKNVNSSKFNSELKNDEWIVDLTGDVDEYPIPLGSIPNSTAAPPLMMCGYEWLCIPDVKGDNSEGRLAKTFHHFHKQKCLELVDRDESEEEEEDDDDNDDNDCNDDNDDNDDNVADRDDGDGDTDDNDDDDKDDNYDGDEFEEKEEGFIRTNTEVKVDAIQKLRIKRIPSRKRNVKPTKSCQYKERHHYESLEQISPVTGNLVHRYATKWSAAEAMQMPSPHPIMRCCLGKQKICYNFHWRFSSTKVFPGA